MYSFTGQNISRHTTKREQKQYNIIKASQIVSTISSPVIIQVTVSVMKKAIL
jgi:hypothetical protein